MYNCTYPDEDECQMSPPPPCAQDCINTVGSYRCACGVGYALDRDGESCNGTFYSTVISS